MTNSNQLSRRQFFAHGAALAAAGLAVPYFIPRGVLAANDRPGANDRVGVGYIAAGRRAMQLPLPKDAQTVAYCDVDHTRADQAAAKAKCLALYDYHQLLDRKDIDAVIVASPDHWHALHTIHACQARKHVYVEKPATLTIAEGRLMVQTARKYNCIVQTGSHQRSMPANRRGCELVRNGEIGKVHEIITFNYPSPWECRFPAQPVRKGLDWDAWCGPVEPIPFNMDIFIQRSKPGWISMRPFSGGEMTGWGAHGLDQIQWALGMDQSGPREVWVEGPKFDPPTYTAPESVDRGNAQCAKPMVFFRYPGDIVVKLDDGPHGGAIFIGDKGKITIDRGICKVESDGQVKDSLKDSNENLNLQEHLQNWFDCIKSGKLPVADVEIGHRSATVCHLGNIARWVGRKLTWDPEKETFPGDDEANKYLSRPMREPYQLPQSI